MLFSNPGIIKREDTESFNYLKIFGANCYGHGLDKLSFNKRIEWVDKNIENIINYENGILLKQSKSKELFLSFCMEFVRYYKFLSDENLVEFKTYLPIQLDATCNGFQHLAMLSQEKDLFEQLNLTIHKNNKKSKKTEGDYDPGDFYNFMVVKLYNKLEGMLFCESIDIQHKESLIRLNNFVWNRNVIKKAVMTKPYNAAKNTIVKYVKEALLFVKKDEIISHVNGVEQTKYIMWYSLEENDKNIINNHDIDVLVGLIDEIIYKDFLRISKLIDYLRNVASLCCKLNVPISWSLPHGLNIKQSYLEVKTTRVSVFNFSKTRLNIKIPDNNKLNKSKQSFNA